MTPDERNLLQRFLQDLARTPSGGKDPEADSMIAATLRESPDAAYVLVQHAILSDQALQAAQGQIAALQAQQAQAGPARSFLGGGSSGGGQSAWAPQPSQTPPPYAPPSGPPEGPGYPGPGPFSSGGGLGSFLRGAGTTAAGVAGGALLFEGLSGLFGGHGGGGGLGGFGGGGLGGLGGGGQQQPVVENVTNNYYDDNDDRDDDGGSDDDGGWDDSNDT